MGYPSLACALFLRVAKLGLGRFFFTAVADRDWSPLSTTLARSYLQPGTSHSEQLVCLHGPCHQHLHPNPRALDAHYKSDHFRWAERKGHLRTASDLGLVQEPFTDVVLPHGPTSDAAQGAQGTSTTDESAPHHICTICETSFARKGDLDRHSKKHRAPAFFCPFYDCRFNTRGFCRRDKLASHMRQGHKVDY